PGPGRAARVGDDSSARFDGATGAAGDRQAVRWRRTFPIHGARRDTLPPTTVRTPATSSFETRSDLRRAPATRGGACRDGVRHRGSRDGPRCRLAAAVLRPPANRSERAGPQPAGVGGGYWYRGT